MNESRNGALTPPEPLVAPRLRLIGATDDSYVIQSDLEEARDSLDAVVPLTDSEKVTTDVDAAVESAQDSQDTHTVAPSLQLVGADRSSYNFTLEDEASFLVSDDEPEPELKPSDNTFSGFAAPDPSTRVSAPENNDLDTEASDVDELGSGPLPFEQMDDIESSVSGSEAFNRDYAAVGQARTELAEVAVKLRGKYTSKTNRKLKQKYDSALNKYQLAYEKAGDSALESLRADGVSEEDIEQSALLEQAVEIDLMKEASLEAYLNQNPTEEDQEKMSKDKQFVQYWSQLSTKQKLARTVAGGAALPLLVGGAGFIAGSAIAGGIAGAVTTRALKTVGLYKINKETRLFKDLSTRDVHSEKLDGRIKQRISSSKMLTKLVKKLSENEADAKNDAFNSLRVLSHALDNDTEDKGIAKLSALTLAASFERRVEKDQSRNKKRLGLVAVSAVAGAGIGSLVHDVVDAKTNFSFSRGDSSSTVFRQDTVSTPRATIDTDTAVETVQPTTPTSLPEVAVTPESVPVVPAVEPTVADADPVVTVTAPEVTASVETVPAITVPETDAANTPLPSEPIITTNPDAVVPEIVNEIPSIDTSSMQSIYIAPGGGIEDGLQDQFGLTDDQSTRAFAAMRPSLVNQPGTYLEGNDVRVLNPGQLDINPLAAEALARFLEEEFEEVAA